MQMAALIHLWHEYPVCPQAAALLLQDVSSLCVCRLSSVHLGTAGNQTGPQQQVSVSWVENHEAEQVGDKCVCWWGVCSTASRTRDKQRYHCNISVCYYCQFCLIINLNNFLISLLIPLLCHLQHDLLSCIAPHALMTNTKPACVMRYQFHQILKICFNQQHSGFSHSLTITKQPYTMCWNGTANPNFITNIQIFSVILLIFMCSDMFLLSDRSPSYLRPCSSSRSARTLFLVHLWLSPCQSWFFVCLPK